MNLRTAILISILFCIPVYAHALSIRDDATGGDCTTIGIWDESTKTCTLNQHVGEQIVVEDSGVTLDGGKSESLPPFFVDGVVRAQQGKEHITIRNIQVRGVFVDYTKYTTIDTVESLNSNYGLYGSYSTGLSVSHSYFHNNTVGMYLNRYTATTTLRDNRFEANQTNIYFEEIGKGHDIDTSNTVEGKKLYYNEDISDQTFTGLDAGGFFCARCMNITIASSTFAVSHLHEQILLLDTSSSTITSSVIGESSISSIMISGGDRVTIASTTISAGLDAVGLSLANTEHSVVEHNTFVHNNGSATSIALYSSKHTLITENSFSYGLSVLTAYDGAQGVFVHNSILTHVGYPIALYRNDTDIQISQPLPVGGNFWYDNRDCDDITGESVCDNAFTISTFSASRQVRDEFPWKVDHGWELGVAHGGYSNVLFIPGIQASRLYRMKRADEGGGVKRLWEPTSNRDVYDLALTDEGTDPILTLPEYEVFTQDVVDEAYIEHAGPNIYKSFLADLSTLKAEGTIADFATFAYDWRRGLDEIIRTGEVRDGKVYFGTPVFEPLIRQMITDLTSTSQTGKVTLVAHSNGGLLVRLLIKTLEDAQSPLLDRIDKVVFVASPQVGTPASILALLHGYNQGIPDDGLPFVLSPATAREFANNLPGAYTLLPSQKYFSSVSTPVAVFSTSTPAYKEHFGEEIASEDTLTNFLTDTTGRVHPDSSNTKVPTFIHRSLLDRAQMVHDAIDSLIFPSSIEVFQIAGWGVPSTISGVTYEMSRCLRVSCGFLSKTVSPVPLFTVEGDGTLVVPSALWSDVGERYWVDLKRYNIDSSSKTGFGLLPFNHANILEVNQVRDLINCIIKHCPRDVLPQYISTSSPIQEAGDSGLVFTLKSLHTMQVYDSLGRHTGVSTSTHQVETEIPDSFRFTFDDTEYVFLPSADTYHILVQPTSSSGEYTPTSITVRPPGSAQPITALLDIPTISSSTVSITVFPDVHMSASLDTDSNGIIDQEYDVLPSQIVEVPPAHSVQKENDPVLPVETQSTVQVVSANGPVVTTTLLQQMSNQTQPPNDSLMQTNIFPQVSSGVIHVPVVTQEVRQDEGQKSDTHKVKVAFVSATERGEVEVGNQKNNAGLSLVANISSAPSVQQLEVSQTKKYIPLIILLLIIIFVILYRIR